MSRRRQRPPSSERPDARSERPPPEPVPDHGNGAEGGQDSADGKDRSGALTPAEEMAWWTRIVVGVSGVALLCVWAVLLIRGFGDTDAFLLLTRASGHFLGVIACLLVLACPRFMYQAL